MLMSKHGEEDEAGSLVLRTTQFTGDFETGEARHRIVENRQIRFVLSNSLKGRIAIAVR